MILKLISSQKHYENILLNKLAREREFSVNSFTNLLKSIIKIYIYAKMQIDSALMYPRATVPRVNFRAPIVLNKLAL